jgi:hypothetical protein
MSRANNDPHPRQQPSPHSFARAEEASDVKEYHIFGSRFVPFVESNRAAGMSALGQKQKLQCVCAMSALPPKADID